MADVVDPDEDVPEEDLVDMPEIARRAKVARPTVSVWRERHDDFPRPYRQLTIGAIWRWPDVEAWLRRTGRLTQD